MKKLTIILFPIIIILAGCGDDDVSAPTLISVSTIDTPDPDLFEKTVILYEDDKYLITTYFDVFISSYPYATLHRYEELKQKAIQDTVTYDTLLMQDYIKDLNDRAYIVAHHLENGSCLIYDKQSTEIISTIKLEYYSEGGPMSTPAGRRFYIKDLLFLKTVDFIS